MKSEKELEKLMKLLEDHGVKGCFLLTDNADISFFNDDSALHESVSRMKVIIDGFEEMRKMEWVEDHIAEHLPKTTKDSKRYIG